VPTVLPHLKTFMEAPLLINSVTVLVMTAVVCWLLVIVCHQQLATTTNARQLHHIPFSFCLADMKLSRAWRPRRVFGKL